MWAPPVIAARSLAAWLRHENHAPPSYAMSEMPREVAPTWRRIRRPPRPRKLAFIPPATPVWDAGTLLTMRCCAAPRSNSNASTFARRARVQLREAHERLAAMGINGCGGADEFSTLERSTLP
jgi:hypothetical protein